MSQRRATCGEAAWRDHDLVGAGEAELTRYRREHVGFVFQFYNLIPSLTVLENMARRKLGRLMFARTMIAFGLLFASGVAANASYCISCTEPTATYVCTPEDSQKLADFNIGGERLGRLCAKILAKLEKHAHCEFLSDTAKPCDGNERIVSLTDVERALAGNGEPRPPSLVEKAATAVSNAGQAVKEQASKTGNTLAGAWHCLKSLFKECGH